MGNKKLDPRKRKRLADKIRQYLDNGLRAVVLFKDAPEKDNKRWLMDCWGIGLSDVAAANQVLASWRKEFRKWAKENIK